MKNKSTTIIRISQGAWVHFWTFTTNLMERNSCCIFDMIKLVLCYMNCSRRAKPLLGLSIKHHWWDWAYYSRKNSSTTTPGQHYSNAHPNVVVPVKIYLKTFHWKALRSWSYSPIRFFFQLWFFSIDGTWSVRVVLQKIASKDEALFRHEIRMLPEILENNTFDEI